MAERMLGHAQARRLYDRIGARQDSQAFYEEPALEALRCHLARDAARAVVEFGCGTGRLAGQLLESDFPPDARYLGLDVSPTMVALTRARLARFGARAEVRLTDGAPRVPAPDASFDRFVSTYVLDLLAEPDLAAVLGEAHRVLRPGGLAGFVGLTPGRHGAARVVTRVWRFLHRVHPVLVGGCRPLELASRLPAGAWRLRHHERVTAWGVASEVLVAERS